MNERQSFDYIIIGAGTTGCVIASRLSENPDTRVLLLEAGGMDDKPGFHNSDLMSYLSTWWSDADWQYMSEPEQYLNGRKVPLSQGKVVGGGSAINGMMHVRGSRHDYDYWQYLGNEGWGYDQVLPYFKKSENYEGGASEYRGVGGPINVVDYKKQGPAALAFLEAAVEMGYGGPPWDFNGPILEGHASNYQYAHTEDGKRCSASVGYLYPALERPNLTLETGAMATRLLMDGTRVNGVEYVQNGSTHNAIAEGEVIVSAGAFASPKLLMLSGIGPAEHLRSHDIPVVVNLPGVGQNMQDHVLVRMGFECDQEQPEPGVISEVGIFSHTRNGMQGAAPELQIMFSAFLFMDNQAYIGGTHLLCPPTLLRPQSRGTVTLRSNNPMDLATVRTNWLQCDSDLQVLIDGVKIVRELVNTKAFAKVGARELMPGPGIKTDKELAEHIRNENIWTEWHPSCTCKMGRDYMSVVDPQLRVYGVDKLRVADASIMPSVVSGNINVPCLMIGEKTADMIRGISG